MPVLAMAEQQITDDGAAAGPMPGRPVSGRPRGRFGALLALGLMGLGLSGVPITGTDVAEGDDAAPAGRLVIVGGGLSPDNAEIHRRLIDLAGGPEHARIGVLPTASQSSEGARNLVEQLQHFGLAGDRVEVLDLTAENAATVARDPAMVARINACTGLFFAGGDQNRITRALLDSDGSDTPALTAIRDVLARGGFVGGTSAGAAVMSELMISRGGALETLDYGLARQTHQRGTIVGPGLGFYRAGLIDQHFNQRGRLARLARVLLERRLALGIGIDEDTAIVAEPDGSFEVLGAGGVTVVEADAAEGSDSPLGFRARDLQVSYLERGDRFDTTDRTCLVHPDKTPLGPEALAAVVGTEPADAAAELYGSEVVRRTLTRALIADLAAQAAGGDGASEGPAPAASGPSAPAAVASVTVRTGPGLYVRYRQGRGPTASVGHGYRFQFTRTEQTAGHRGTLAGRDTCSVVKLRLDVEPVTGTLEPAESGRPRDLAGSRTPAAIEALVFRDIMRLGLDGTFRPAEHLTRAEFADVLARAANLWRREPGVRIRDVPADAPYAADVAAAVAAGLLSLDDDAVFRPDAPVSRRELSAALARARQLAGSTAESDADGEPDADADEAQLIAPATREDAAVAVARFLGLAW